MGLVSSVLLNRLQCMRHSLSRWQIALELELWFVVAHGAEFTLCLSYVVVLYSYFMCESQFPTCIVTTQRSVDGGQIDNK